MKPSILDVMPLVKAFRDKPGNNVGGVLYTVLNSGNIDDRHIIRAKEIATERKDSDALVIIELMMQMTKTQRKKLSSQFYD